MFLPWSEGQCVKFKLVVAPGRCSQKEADQGGKCRPETQPDYGWVLQNTWHNICILAPILLFKTPCRFGCRAACSSNCMNRSCPMRQFQLLMLHQLFHLLRILQLEDCVRKLTDRADSIEGQPGILLGPGSWTLLLSCPAPHQPVYKLRKGRLGQQLLHCHSLKNFSWYQISIYLPLCLKNYHLCFQHMLQTTTVEDVIRKTDLNLAPSPSWLDLLLHPAIFNIALFNVFHIAFCPYLWW